MSAALKERLDAHDTHIKEVADNLTRHVTECSAIQKRVLWVGGITLGWVVGHSPEAVVLLKSVVDAAGMAIK